MCDILCNQVFSVTKQEAIESKEKNKAIYTGLAIRDTFEDTNRRRKSRHIMSRKQIREPFIYILAEFVR